MARSIAARSALRDRRAGRAGRASVKPEARISALCWATIRFSSTVMPANRRMFWNVRATRAELARCVKSGSRSSRNSAPSGVRAARIMPSRRLVEAGDAVEHRGLAGAVRADQRGDVAAARVEGEIVDGDAGRRSAWSDARRSRIGSVRQRLMPRPSATMLGARWSSSRPGRPTDRASRPDRAAARP